MTGEGRGLVWRRLVAAAIDGVLFVAAASLASVALYTVTGGVARAYTFSPATRCEPLTVPSPEVARAAQRALGSQSAKATLATSCRRLFLGLESGRFISVTFEAKQGESLMAATVFQPVDRAGRPLQPLSLGWIYPLAFVLLKAGLEWRGATPGKAGVGLGLASANGGRLTLRQALARNLVAGGWLVAGGLLTLAAPHLARWQPSLVAAWSLVQILYLVVVGALAAAALALLLTGRPDAAYDRWAGVRVVRA